MIKIEIERKTRQVYLSNGYIGNDNENLQDILEFSFLDEFVNGQARLELQFGNNGEKTFIVLDKVNQTYTIPVTNVMTKAGKVFAQLVITEGTDIESVPLFKSNIFYFYVNESINAETGADEPYIEWIDRANIKLNQIDNLDIEAEKVEHTTTITVTRKDGTSYEVEVLDGEDGTSLENIAIVNRNLEVTYGGETENLGQVAPNIQIGTTTTGLPNTQASVTNVGTELNPILNFSIPKGEAGAIKMVIVNELPSVGSEDTIYLLPIQDPETGNNYDEYIYVNGNWEKLGGIQVEVDLSDYYTKSETYNKGEVDSLIPSLTDYVKNTDYATSSKGGVVKSLNTFGVSVSGSGEIMGNTKTYEQYGSWSNAGVISKGTLENVITGKGLVSNTDYADGSTGGTFKTASSFNTAVSSTSRILYALSSTYAQYQNKDTGTFISKGTLENVLNARIGDIDSVLDAINGEVI